MSRFSFRQVGGSRKYRSWKKFEEGDYFIGKLIKDYEDQFGNTGYEIEVIETDFAKADDNMEEGALFGVNGCGSLNYKMKEVNDGAIVRIEYLGQEKVEKGPMKGKDFHNVGLQVDESAVDVAAVKKAQDSVQVANEIAAVEAELDGEDYDLD